jgi:S1/P1 Nuclease
MDGTVTAKASRGKRMVRRALAFAAVFCLATQQGWAWGREGHRLTALVADQYLKPETKAQIAELLGKESLEDIASWADDYRAEHPETAKWHYVDIPKGQKFDRIRDCPLPSNDAKSPWRDCVTDRILYFEGRLGDTALSPAERTIALKFLVHFIGDVHQPFHAYGDDRGGNGVRVTFLGSTTCGTFPCNLHAVWDESIIEDQGLSEKKYTDRLMQEIKDNNWERLSGGEPTTWANISHHYAEEAVAPNGALITRAYVTEEARIVDAQLALGGLRLARVLNRILGSPDTEAVPQTPSPRTPLPIPKTPTEVPSDAQPPASAPQR